jgi:putative membrane protein insertion efficiency factor
MRGLLVQLLLVPLRFYKWAISPFLPPMCRFHPSCSVYAMGALAVHGPVKGTWLAARRVARCHPFNPGGLDPVLGIPRLKDAYLARDPEYPRGITVPAIVDVPTGQVVTNDFVANGGDGFDKVLDGVDADRKAMRTEMAPLREIVASYLRAHPNLIAPPRGEPRLKFHKSACAPAPAP